MPQEATKRRTRASQEAGGVLGKHGGEVLMLLQERAGEQLRIG